MRTPPPFTDSLKTCMQVTFLAISRLRYSFECQVILYRSDRYGIVVYCLPGLAAQVDN